MLLGYPMSLVIELSFTGDADRVLTYYSYSYLMMKGLAFGVG